MLDFLAGQNGRFLLRLAVYFAGFGLLLFGMFSYVPLLLETEQSGVPPDEITQTLIEGLLEASGRRPGSRRALAVRGRRPGRGPLRHPRCPSCLRRDTPGCRRRGPGRGLDGRQDASRDRR